MSSETRLRGEILQRIHQDYPPSKREVLVFGRPAGAATGPGHPDLFGVACGHFLALEIKYGSKSKPTPLQIRHIQDLRMAGAYAWVVRSTLDATRAVYQAKLGGRMPQATDPIDFDDWFKEITSAAPTTSIAGTAEPSTEADSTALDLSLDLEAESAAQPEVAVERPRRAHRKTKQPVDDLQATRDAGLLNADQPEPSAPIQAQAAAEYDLAYVVDLVRAVGDRVTEVWEVAARLDTKQDLILDRLHKLQLDFDTLLEDDAG